MRMSGDFLNVETEEGRGRPRLQRLHETLTVNHNETWAEFTFKLDLINVFRVTIGPHGARWWRQK